MKYQEGTDVEEGHEEKYAVGCPLIFVEVNPEEAEATPGWECPFEAGDRLVPLEVNNGGFGIMVRRVDDDHTDMVWPEEVVSVHEESL